MKINLESRSKKIMAGTAAVFAFGAVLAAVSSPAEEAADLEAVAVSVDADDGIGDGAEPLPVIEEPVIEEPVIPDGTRSDPFPFANDRGPIVTVNNWGDSAGSQWLAVVDGPDLPVKREGEIVFFAALQLQSANKEPLSTWLDFDFEVVGGSTNEVHTDRCDSDLWYDQDSESKLDQMGEQFVGGSSGGFVCIGNVPAEDINHPNTTISIEVGNDYRVYFGPFGG